MNEGNTLLGLGFLAAMVGVYCMIRITSYLSTRGEKVNFFLLRLKWFGYMSRYRELTLQENGEVGSFHRGYIVSMLVSLVLIIAGALLLNR